MLAQHLGDAQHQVGRGGTVGELAGEAEADDLRDQHVNRLAEHDRFGLDAADAPAQDAEPVDHRRVRVGADQRVGIQHVVLVPYHLGEVLEVDLMDDPGRRGDDAEVVERTLSPLEKLVALAIAPEFPFAVDRQRHAAVEGVDLHRVIDDQIAENERVDLLGIAAHPLHCRAHRGEVDDRGHTGEILQHDTPRDERDLGFANVARVVGGQRFDVLAGDDVSILMAQAGLEKHFDRVGDGVERTEPRQGVEPVDGALTERRFEHGSGVVPIIHVVFQGGVASEIQVEFSPSRPALQEAG